MSIMDSTTPASSHHEPIPVNRFALFSETLLAGLLVLVLSLPLVTIPAAYAAGIAHLERHLAGRDDSVRGLWGTFRAALPGSWKLGLLTAAAAVAIVLNLLLAWVGQLPGGEVVLPATLLLAGCGAILLLRTTAAWSDTSGAATDAGGAWRSALETGKALSLQDWTGSLLLAAALFGAAVFVWMLVALFVVVPGTLILAAAAVKLRSHRA
ncbi:Poxvirus protein I5 [Arthrobacter nitrophenolicus]|uniref:Poxvirus protein I5 n=1 Tax=Arthrobacter nitrophenolicus TaxID=683150 RepID=A0A4R5Y138_9MICC|nr:Poxvirus protein I5 [Arthrobacter nitrophenolicus]TDL37216.1 Poxvirus protein I5 [Arthrobacter nitrophenolicus]